MGLIKRIVSAVKTAADWASQPLETKSLSPANRVYYAGLLLYAGEAELDPKNTYGAAEAARLTAEGTDWAIFLGKELAGRDIRDVNTERTIDQFPKDSVWIVAPGAPDGDTYDLVAEDFGKWKRGLNKLVGNGYQAKNDRDEARLVAAITVATAVTAAVLSVVATPAAGAAAGAVGAGIVGAVKAGDDPAAVSAAVADGTMDASAALAEQNPEAAEVLADAAEVLLVATEAATDATTTTTEAEAEAEPAPRFTPRFTPSRGLSAVKDNPIAAAGLGALALLGLIAVVRAIARA